MMCAGAAPPSHPVHTAGPRVAERAQARARVTPTHTKAHHRTHLLGCCPDAPTTSKLTRAATH
jgi:hypothetical protein